FRPTGPVPAIARVPSLPPDAVAAAGARFVGPQRQVPPMFSALKREGVPLYKLARRGIAIERAAREIEIGRFEVTLRDPEHIRFAVGGSNGPYVRVLAAEDRKSVG